MDELVLIVDDNELNAKLACDVLERAGMRTLTAGTASEAVLLAREHAPDIVLMDLRLPDLDGTAAAGRLAEDESTAAIPVVAMSALPFEDAESWFRESGFADYIEKPIDIRELPDRVRRLLARG